MKAETPTTTKPIDQLKVAGTPLDRSDGPLKPMGGAREPYEHPTWLRTKLMVNPRCNYRPRADKFDRNSHGRRRAWVIAIVAAADAGRLDNGKFDIARHPAGPEVEHNH